MSLTSVALLCALGLALAWLFHRERSWRAQLRQMAAAGALPITHATPSQLLERIQSLAAIETDRARELYLRRLFEALLNEIRQGVVIVDRELRIRFANRTIAQLFHTGGIRRDHLLLAEIQDHEAVETVKQALATGKRVVRQIRLTGHPPHQGASARHFIIEASPLSAPGEKGAWLMVQDITEQVMADQIRKDFVANASHELRTPLTLIQGYVETLQQGGFRDAEMAEHSLAVMEKHGQRIGRIVEDMLTISKLEDGGTPLNIEPFNVEACVNDVIDHLRPMTENRPVLFEVDFPTTGSRLAGDRFYWDQIFTNLIENAVKENADRELTVRVKGEWFADHCILTVTDNGVGIAAHDIPFVFKRFYRGHRHHAQTIKGTGLGLSIVRRAIEAHGGSIDLESTPGVFTTFRMRVPLRDPSASVGDEIVAPQSTEADASPAPKLVRIDAPITA